MTSCSVHTPSRQGRQALIGGVASDGVARLRGERPCGERERRDRRRGARLRGERPCGEREGRARRERRRRRERLRECGGRRRRERLRECGGAAAAS